LGSAFHLAFLNHMHEFDAAQQNACNLRVLNSEAWSWIAAALRHLPKTEGLPADNRSDA